MSRVLPLAAGLLAGAGAYHALQSHFQKEFSGLQKSLSKLDADLKPPFVRLITIVDENKC
jgi:hypothetical protein